MLRTCAQQDAQAIVRRLRRRDLYRFVNEVVVPYEALERNQWKVRASLLPQHTQRTRAALPTWSPCFHAHTAAPPAPLPAPLFAAPRSHTTAQPHNRGQAPTTADVMGFMESQDAPPGGLRPDDVVVCESKIDFAMKNKNPLDKVRRALYSSRFSAPSDKVRCGVCVCAAARAALQPALLCRRSVPRKASTVRRRAAAAARAHRSSFSTISGRPRPRCCARSRSAPCSAAASRCAALRGPPRLPPAPPPVSLFD